MVYLTKHVKERMKERCKDWDVTMLVTMASMAIKCGMKFKKTVFLTMWLWQGSLVKIIILY